jgi:hypothetical protein
MENMLSVAKFVHFITSVVRQELPVDLPKIMLGQRGDRYAGLQAAS